MSQLALSIEGMSCGHCVRRVSEALTALKGVQVKDVSIGSATVDYDPARISPPAIVAAIDEAGYAASANK
jgi:copper chaperone CopZ